MTFRDVTVVIGGMHKTRISLFDMSEKLEVQRGVAFGFFEEKWAICFCDSFEIEVSILPWVVASVAWAPLVVEACSAGSRSGDY